MRSPAWALAALLSASPSLAGNLLWIVDGRPTRQAVEILETLNQADEHGLIPGHYTVEMQRREMRLVLAGRADPALQARFDAALLRSVSLFVSDLHRGRVSAEAAGFDLPRRSVAVGDEFSGASQLRKLLVAVGDLDAAAQTQPVDVRIDTALGAAVRRFQLRHGLSADGVIGPQTYAALTTPLTSRVRQMELTLERWRWLSQLPRPNIVANIPQFTLYALPRAEHEEQDIPHEHRPQGAADQDSEGSAISRGSSLRDRAWSGR